MTEGIVNIKAGREKSILRQHPWIFSGAIETHAHTVPGELVKVVDHQGRFLARGYWNPKSQIQVRLLTWQDEPIDAVWWRRMLLRAIESRGVRGEQRRAGQPVAYRLINAENDFLPGLIVDDYAGWLVLQALTLHIDRQKRTIAHLLADLLKPRGIYERSDVDVRGKEGLKPETGLLWGMESPPECEIIEADRRFLVDLRHGHKTGFYLDQAANRQLLRTLLETRGGAPTRVLNLFSYTGGFGVHALAVDGVQVVNVDSSQDALTLTERTLALNHPQTPAITQVKGDCLEYVRASVKQGEQFDIVVCDPPKFAQNTQQVEKAAWGYKDLNLHAFKLIRPGGWLLTFSCSGAISRDLFQKIIFGALDDSGRQAQIIQQLGAAPDHPIALTFPEGEYLKGLLLRVY